MVSEPLRPRDVEIAKILFEKDRDLVKKIVAHNRYGVEKCGWVIE